MAVAGAASHRDAQSKTLSIRALRANALKLLGEELEYAIYPFVRSRELIGSIRPCLTDRYIQVSFQERDSQTEGMLLEQTVVLDVTRWTYAGRRLSHLQPARHYSLRSGSSIRMRESGLGQDSQARDRPSAYFGCQWTRVRCPLIVTVTVGSSGPPCDPPLYRPFGSAVETG
ncbi:MAG: hypothetical protein ACJ74Z_17605 [Bryobacteraceae bacterium]